jgi:hypothetical protein
MRQSLECGERFLFFHVTFSRGKSFHDATWSENTIQYHPFLSWHFRDQGSVFSYEVEVI